MHTFFSKLPGMHCTSVTREGERLCILALTVQISLPHTVRTDALAHIYTEALLAGCGTYTRMTFLDALALLGSTIGITVDDGAVTITVQSIDTRLSQTMSLFTTMLTQPLFKQSEIKRIKEHMVNLFTLSKENARLRAGQGFIAELTDEHDYRHPFPIDDTITAIRKITRDELVGLHQILLQGFWIVTCSGNSTSVKRISKVVATIHQVPSIEESAKSIALLHKSKRRIKLIDIPNKQNIEFSIGNILPISFSHDAFPALSFGMSVLGLQGGFVGRLMSIVREKEGLTYGIYGTLEKVTCSDSGFWKISTFFNPKDAQQGITSTLREIERIRESGITNDELRRFKNILKTRFALTEDSIIKKTREVHTRAISGITHDAFNSFRSHVEAMTRPQVHTALQNYLETSSLIISGAGPIQQVKKDLLKFIA